MGHDRDQRLFPPGRVVAGQDTRSMLVDVGRQVRQELSGPVERFGFGVHGVVDGAIRCVDVGVTKLFFGMTSE